MGTSRSFHQAESWRSWKAPRTGIVPAWCIVAKVDKAAYVEGGCRVWMGELWFLHLESGQEHPSKCCRRAARDIVF